MAKVAKVFCRQNGVGNSDLYTVPVGKFVVANASWTGTNAANGLEIGGVVVLAAQAHAEKGLALPAGTTFRLTMTNGSGIVSGFEYDA